MNATTTNLFLSLCKSLALCCFFVICYSFAQDSHYVQLDSSKLQCETSTSLPVAPAIRNTVYLSLQWLLADRASHFYCRSLAFTRCLGPGHC